MRLAGPRVFWPRAFESEDLGIGGFRFGRQEASLVSLPRLLVSQSPSAGTHLEQGTAPAVWVLVRASAGAASTALRASSVGSEMSPKTLRAFLGCSECESCRTSRSSC